MQSPEELEISLFGAPLNELLYGNGILGLACATMQHARVLAAFLEHEAEAKVLELTLTALCGEGVPLVASALHTSQPQLSVLNLDDCELGDDEIAVLATELAGIPALSSLSLEANRISDRGAAALGALLGTAGCALLELRLARNAITAAGCDALVRHLGAANKARQYSIELAENPCGGDGAGNYGPSFGLAKAIKAGLKKRSAARLWLLPRADAEDVDDDA